MKEERYFYVPNARYETEFPEEEAIHAVRVLRLQPGDRVFLMDGQGSFFEAEITLVTKKSCMYRLTENETVFQRPKVRVHLAIAPTKNIDRIEWMAEKITEIGIDELTFLNCRFSERTKVRIDRIEKIVVSAVKQSRKAWMPKVNEIKNLKEFISEERNGGRYICHCYEEFSKKDLLMMLRDLRSERCGKIDAEDDTLIITIMVGPEGDFSIDEVQSAIDNGFQSVTLGDSRLRTETAGLMAVATCEIANNH